MRKLIASIFLFAHISASPFESFEELVKKYAEKKEVTRAQVIAAYDALKDRIDIKVANQCLQVLLDRTISELRTEESSQNIDGKTYAKKSPLKRGKSKRKNQ
jgi:hypothetical protein